MHETGITDECTSSNGLQPLYNTIIQSTLRYQTGNKIIKVGSHF